ncbi:protein of unknown function [Tepidibacter aestuarii]|nr:protein of unknown function [Tepidibacter aestuarii]
MVKRKNMNYSMLSVVFFVHEHTINSFMFTYARSFYFGLMHAIGNFTFTYLLGKVL